MSPRVIAAVWQSGQDLPAAAGALVDAALDVCGNLAELDRAG
jgi:hypothetical protein